MRPAKRFIIICLLAAMGFAVFITIHLDKTFHAAKQHTQDHARVIANALWTFEESSAAAYLTLATQSYGYERILVEDDLGKIFINIQGEPLSGTDLVLSSIGLITRNSISLDIVYEDRTIGRITAIWRCKAIYTYLYVLVCIILTLFGIWFFLRQLEMNKTLESRVQKRTSELEMALDELRKGQEKYRSLVENIPGAVYHYINDENWTPLFYSDAVEEITGHPANAFLTSRIDFCGDIIHPEDRPVVRQAVNSALRHGRSYAVEYRIIDSKGELRWVSEKGQGESWSTGKPEYFTGAIFDITSRKLAEHELIRVQNLLNNILDSMPSVLVGVDNQGIVTHWNQEAEHTTGVPASNARGQRLDKVFPGLSREMPNVHRAIREQKVLTTPRLPRTHENDIRLDDVTVFPLVADGMEGAVIRVDDVTERVRIEEMMVQTEKMMSVGGLAAGMAHEINNPLGGILQGAQNIERRLTPDLPGNIKAAKALGCDLDMVHAYLKERNIMRMLKGIQESGLRAAKIVSNMLEFSRKSGTNMTSCNLNELLDTVVALAENDYDLKKNYDFKKVTIIRRYDPELPTVVCAHTEIEQVLFNLLKNAAYAMAQSSMQEDPTITLETHRHSSHAILQVSDNGPGMEPETRRRIFEPFFTTKPPGVGTGLGLSVSYFIITQNHGGEFIVESTPGRGTSFTIKLPISGNE